jgi:hypothetical protein
MFKTIISSFLFCSLLLSCKIGIKATKKSEVKVHEIELSRDYLIPKKNSPYEISNAYLNKSILSIVVNYSGGCQNHEWALKGSTSFLKSLPPKKGLFLEHKANGDVCRTFITDTINFDIEKVKYPGKESNYTVIIQLGNFNQNITFEY